MSTSKHAVSAAPRPATEPGAVGLATGVLPSQQLREAVRHEWVGAGNWRIPAESIQPASLDLRLGEYAWALRCSFLPDSRSTVEEKIEDLAFQRIDLRDGATLERDRPYLVPLMEELSLPTEVRARANPKSSTGRLDVFTRVITDRNHRFDEIAAGYRGKLYLEVVPRSFAIHVKTGLALNQVRLISGDARLTDEELVNVHEEFPLLYLDSHALRASELSISDGLFVSLDISGSPENIVGYRAKRNSLPVDSGASGRSNGTTTGSPCTRRRASGSCSSPRSSTCCSRPRGSASHRHTRPRCSLTTRLPASCALTTRGSSTRVSATRATARGPAVVPPWRCVRATFPS